MSLDGLSHVNVELTSRCNKSCWMCGRRKMEREHPDLCDWGDMPIEMVEDIADQLPPGITVQLHNNGEPLLYPHLSYAIGLFNKQITGLDTNGKLLLEQAEDISDLNTLTISIIPNDPENIKKGDRNIEGGEQIGIVIKYLRKYPSTERPLVILRILGENLYEKQWRAVALEHKCLVVKRILHSPDGSHGYEKSVTIPEMGICLELLHKLSIDRYGNVSPCVRFDPKGDGILGNINDLPLCDIWNGPVRRQRVAEHTKGWRNLSPLCAECDYWGIPRG